MNISRLPVINASGQTPTPAPKLDMGGFSALLDKVTKANDAALAQKAEDAVEVERDEAALRRIYERLTPEARRTVERINAGAKDVTEEEWRKLREELKDAEAISQTDYEWTRPDLRLIPIGYTDKNGNMVLYHQPAPVIVDRLRACGEGGSAAADGKYRAVHDDAYGWSGDPLEYLDRWANMLTAWRSEIARMGAAHPNPDFSPINDQINSCRKVAELIRSLGRI